MGCSASFSLLCRHGASGVRTAETELRLFGRLVVLLVRRQVHERVE